MLAVAISRKAHSTLEAEVSSMERGHAKEQQSSGSSQQTTVTVTAASQGNARVTITVDHSGNGDGAPAAPPGGGGGGDDEDDAALAARLRELNLKDCEYDRVFDRELNVFRRCKHGRAPGSRFCAQHRDMMVRKRRDTKDST